MGISKFNKGEFIFTNAERFDEFHTLEDLYIEGKKEHLVLGLYSYSSTYGKGVFAKSGGYNISLPSHMVKTVEDIRNDSESVKQINEGKVFIEIYSYELPEKYPDKTFYSVNFIVSE